VDNAAAKAAVRARVLAGRAALSTRERARAAARVQAALLALLADRLPVAKAAGNGGSSGRTAGATPPGPPGGAGGTARDDPAGTPGGAGGPASPGGTGGDGTAGGTAVTAYVPMAGEPGGPDLPAVLAAALPPAVDLLLPVLLPDLDLDWARYDGTLRPAGRGLAEPAGARRGPAAVRGAALLVVPALAVDRRGARLGRGGGSYDRALARVSPRAFVVALLHDGELIDGDLPAAPHDRPVTAVITPGAGLTVLTGAGRPMSRSDTWEDWTNRPPMTHY
jgi:5-formyltetrahydrofolate cyclo-ligase